MIMFFGVIQQGNLVTRSCSRNMAVAAHCLECVCVLLNIYTWGPSGMSTCGVCMCMIRFSIDVLMICLICRIAACVFSTTNC